MFPWCLVLSSVWPLLLVFGTAGCRDATARGADSTAVERAAAPLPPALAWKPSTVKAPPGAGNSRRRLDRPAPPARPVTGRADSAAPGSAPPDSARAGGARAVSARPNGPIWPVRFPDPLPGTLLPRYRIVAYYGNPLSNRMGILGQLPPERLLERLEQAALEWAIADPTREVIPALHLIATVAQGRPGPDKKYRLRMSDSLIERVASWAERRNWLLFLDIQVGQSTVRDELPRLLPYLKRPYVHLALDPEFAMFRKPEGRRIPGKYIGTLDAADVNWAIDTVATLVSEHRLPPKVLVVHRFTREMLTNARQITLDPRVQVVIDMDGFGSPALKKATWRSVILREPVQYTGFKLFYNPKNDRPLMTPEQVLELFPAPVYIQYQ
ncbi:MAG TPA: hypothetical protein VNK43_12715 [Gemmatimonadales bacterium]|nr:hypothetical protein [Gemmatimonadales bacterium]